MCVCGGGGGGGGPCCVEVLKIPTSLAIILQVKFTFIIQTSICVLCFRCCSMN